MLHVLNVRVDPASGQMQAELAQNMLLEQFAEVLACAALAYSKITPGVPPRDALDRAVRVLLDNPDALGERSNIILPGRVS